MKTLVGHLPVVLKRLLHDFVQNFFFD